MARFPRLIALITIVFVCLCHIEGLEARKVFLSMGNSKGSSSPEPSLAALTSLPKGSTSTSSPSDETMVLVHQTRHATTRVDRSLGSVPSPGDGH
ncbi:UNVERIFIED_CONTAM: hypothetical protein Sradi_6402700 [Sesamum radiatum]|uniref:Uncharacterized protein n=1 Tax=Sesamum radiatum TaxID=300843 RepID=A0AAW2K369_SESRA